MPQVLRKTTLVAKYDNPSLPLRMKIMAILLAVKEFWRRMQSSPAWMAKTLIFFRKNGMFGDSVLRRKVTLIE